MLGVDLSEQMVARAGNRNERDWLSYVAADATDLPCEDNSYDVVVSTQVAEYVADIEGFCAEVMRVMKPGGRGLIIATDWNAISWHSTDPDRMQRVMQAFAPHCADSSLPRTLGKRLTDAGLRLDDVSYYAIINRKLEEGNYISGMIPFVHAYVSAQGTMPGDQLDAWQAEQVALDREGGFFFATGRFIFTITKAAD